MPLSLPTVTPHFTDKEMRPVALWLTGLIGAEGDFISSSDETRLSVKGYERYKSSKRIRTGEETIDARPERDKWLSQT